MKITVLILGLLPIVAPASTHAQINEAQSLIEFRITHDQGCNNCKQADYHNPVTGKEEILFLGPAALSEEDIDRVEAKDLESNHFPSLIIYFNDAGRIKMSDITGKNINRKLAIVVSGKVVTAPVIRERVYGGSAVLTGNLTGKQIEDLENMINHKIYR